jgi:hypothetical protein
LGGKISPEDSNANVGKPCIVGANGRGKNRGNGVPIKDAIASFSMEG